jgi:ribosomal-protein-alanine N-acetyltransferase
LTYTVRPLAKGDLEQVNAIDREAFPTQWPPPNYRQELQNKIAHYLIASDDALTFDPPPEKPRSAVRRLVRWLVPWLKKTGASVPPQPFIVGFSGIWMMADEAHVTNIAVRQKYQCRGIGGLLLLATIDIACELKASFLTLEVRASNVNAQKLYSRYGFVQTGLRRGYYLDNREDAIIMSTEKIASPEFADKVKALRESLAQKLAAESPGG